MRVDVPGAAPEVMQGAMSNPLVEIRLEDYRRLVHSWTRARGRRPDFPRRIRARLVALHYISRAFSSASAYTEEEVNAAIQHSSPFVMDHVQLRRYLVDYGMLGRREDGSEYRVSRTHLALARWDSRIPRVSLS